MVSITVMNGTVRPEENTVTQQIPQMPTENQPLMSAMEIFIQKAKEIKRKEQERSNQSTIEIHEDDDIEVIAPTSTSWSSKYT